MQKRSSECQTADKPPPYEPKKDELIIAQNQVKLVHYPDRELIDQIDTEPHLTIRQIRDFVRQRLNVNRVQLTFRNRILNNDNETLADYGWSPGECGTITVQTDN